MICSCDYDPPEFYSASLFTARKTFQCEECRRQVPAGERYERVCGKWDGYVCTYKTCLNCVDLKTWMRNNVPCFCFAHGNLFEDVINTCDEAIYQAPEETRGLRFGAARRIVKIRRAAQDSRKAAA